MSHVFISYSRKDSAFVSALSATLRQRGVNLWIDQDNIGGGVFWDDTVEEALKEAACVIAVLSEKFTQSDNVKDEISYAKERNIQIIPIIIEEVANIPFRLGRVQHIDFRTNYSQALDLLLRNVPQEALAATTGTHAETNKETLAAEDLPTARTPRDELTILLPEDRLAAHEGGNYAFPKLVFRHINDKNLILREWIMKVSTIVIGRMNTCDIVLDHEQISRKHAQIYLENGVYWVKDLDSRNGTQVNGEELQGASAQLKNDDEIVLGDICLLVFRLEPGDATLPKPPRPPRP